MSVLRSFRGIAGSLCLLAVVFAWYAPSIAAKTYSFKVRHLHRFGSCQGTLRIDENDVRYDASKRGHARAWSYLQLKRAESRSPRRLALITFEGELFAIPPGRKRTFNFELVESSVGDELFKFLLMRIGQRGASGPPDTPPGGRYELAVKHHHLFGGCEGTLRITPAFIEYVSSNTRHARIWKYIDIKGLGSRSAYKLRVRTYEDQILLFGKDRDYNFELKELLEPTVLEFMRKRLGG